MNNFTLPKNFVYLSTLGKGGFGTVISAFDKSTSRKVAIKCVSHSAINYEYSQKLKMEANVLQDLSHPNIVQYFDLFENEETIFIVMELLEGGTLSSLIKKIKNKKRILNENDASIIIKSIIEAIYYIHKKNIVHRDIKPENIIFAKKNDYSSLKIADFGLSGRIIFTDFTSLCNEGGTLLYMAPECIVSKSYTKAVDIWSVGIIMFKLLCHGIHPFFIQNEVKEEYVQRISNSGFYSFHNLSPLSLSLFKKLIATDINDRYNAQQVLEHPWIQRTKCAIPLTFAENFKRFDTEYRLKSLLLCIIFASSKKQYTKLDLIYHNEIMEISNYIKNWTLLQEENTNRKFTNDSEYKMDEHTPLPSPSKRLTDPEIHSTSKQNSPTSPTRCIKSSDIKVLNKNNILSNVEIRRNANLKKTCENTKNKGLNKSKIQFSYHPRNDEVIHSVNKTLTNHSFYSKSKISTKIDTSEYSPNAIISKEIFKKKDPYSCFRGKSKIEKIPKVISPIKTRTQLTQNVNKYSINKKKEQKININNIPDGAIIKIKQK